MRSTRWPSARGSTWPCARMGPGLLPRRALGGRFRGGLLAGLGRSLGDARALLLDGLGGRGVALLGAALAGGLLGAGDGARRFLLADELEDGHGRAVVLLGPAELDHAGVAAGAILKSAGHVVDQVVDDGEGGELLAR